ncbi:MAG: hypothetical protein ACKOFX_00320, partial [Solirubrobacterales bacterium]
EYLVKDFTSTPPPVKHIAEPTVRRKQLKRVVRTLWSLDAERAGAVVDRAGLDPEARPETLSPSDFAALLRAARAVMGRGAAPLP